MMLKHTVLVAALSSLAASHGITESLPDCAKPCLEKAEALVKCDLSDLTCLCSSVQTLVGNDDVKNCLGKCSADDSSSKSAMFPKAWVLNMYPNGHSRGHRNGNIGLHAPVHLPFSQLYGDPQDDGWELDGLLPERDDDLRGRILGRTKDHPGRHGGDPNQGGTNGHRNTGGDDT